MKERVRLTISSCLLPQKTAVSVLSTCWQLKYILPAVEA